MLFSRFVAEIENHSLLQPNDTVVAAVSGGADSVCLLHLLCRLRPLWNVNVICAHVNHKLRKEADAEAEFVSTLCKKWNVPFRLYEEDVGEKARREKISTELAGRQVRYAFFKTLQADAVMTAHNKNDVSESVLLHMARGCGLDGLCGILSRREDGICRPLLPFTRAEIEVYLQAHECTWCEDPSNLSLEYTRNKIRHAVLPPLCEINPSFTDAIFRMTEILQADKEYLEAQTDLYPVMRREGNAVLFSINGLSEMPLALRRRAVRRAVESFEEVELVLDLLEKRSGSAYTLSGGKRAEKEYKDISVYVPDVSEIPPVLLPMNGEVVFGDWRITTGQGGMLFPKKEYIVRTRHNGDFFSPEGMEGHKKVKDFLIDKKIPRRLRNRIPIITHMDRIAAVGNLRRSREFANCDGETIQIKIERI